MMKKQQGNQQKMRQLVQVIEIAPTVDDERKISRR
jgi:hypothetical protein